MNQTCQFLIKLLVWNIVRIVKIEKKQLLEKTNQEKILLFFTKYAIAQ